MPKVTDTSLKARLKEIIALEGPMTVADYVSLSLHDPKDGYYARHVRLGPEGDFITAPLVSQIFGELIGLWVMQVWIELGAPETVTLVEIGPGDGTLMSDMIRAFRLNPAFEIAVDICLIEPSEPLRDVQSAHLGDRIRHIDSLAQIAIDAPVILIANEVLDCLPVRQFQLAEDGWYERCVGVHEGDLCFGLVPAPKDFVPSFEASLHDLCEASPAQNRFAAAISGLLREAKGAALLIDYGRDVPGPGDTLQAVYRHEKRHPLEAPGQHDLTQWADFPAVSATATGAGVVASPIISQADFLRQLGIIERLEALSAKNPLQTARLSRQVARLIDDDQMGTLFKVLSLSYPPTLSIPGLEAVSVED